ncbi:hypothetical protein AGMMS49546_32500 [Spirochaetia bacterium]|nr:hypothetical protein AGMMS49546_32500 [Spirochaetia bacterium]
MTVFNKEGASLEVTLRLARSDDAPRLIALMKKQHGSAYMPSFYQEDWLRGNIENKVLRIVLAELAGGGAAGMGGLDAGGLFPGSLVLILLTIGLPLRGFGISTHIHQFLLQTAATDPSYTCIYAYCMTLDTISQTLNRRFGSTMTGLVLNRYFYDTRAENYAGLSLPLKRSHVIACLPQAKKDAGLLHVPPAYTAYVSDIYKSLGVSCRLREAAQGEWNAAQPPAQSVLRMIHREQDRYCEIYVQRAGPDFTDILEGTLGEYAGREQQTFNAFINMNDPGAPGASGVLESRGFFFTGVQPLSGEYEYMIFHYSASLPVPFDKITVIPEFKEKFEWIQQRCEEARHGRAN